MDAIEEVKRALRRLTTEEQEEVIEWLERYGGVKHTDCRVEEPRPSHAPTPLSHMTINEFLEFEETSQFRHEYVNGVVRPVSGPTVAHIRIGKKLLFALETHLSGGPCEAFPAELMLRIRSDMEEIIYYPDLVVTCNKEDLGKNWVRNPKLVVEILSPSTQHIDRREKAMAYRRVDSIEEYVLVEQDEHKVTVQRRADNWRPQIYGGPQAIAEFRSISLTVPLAQIYEDTLGV